METYFNLPSDVFFCKKCLMSNQRPSSVPEFRHTRSRDGAKYLQFDNDGVCDACRQSETKDSIGWEDRERELIDLLDRHRKSNGDYDCLVPGSGGKDSAFQAHILKYKYGMNPLTCTWPPILYTDYGLQNFRNWIEVGGFDNITWKQNGKVMKLLTKLSIENLLHPFQTFILGQKNLAPKIAAKFGIDLIFYGENEAEYGNPLADNASSLRDKAFHTMEDFNDMIVAGLPVSKLMDEYGISKSEVMTFLPLPASHYEKTNIEVHYLGYYLKWIPQEAYYYAVENTGFKARPFRTQGTYSKYNSIDDKIDDLHYYTTYIKFGIGRTTYDASQEIRNKHLTREEGQALVKRFDGEFPDRYIDEVLGYLGISNERFTQLCDEFRSPHLWAHKDGKWKLRHTVNSDGVDD
ncbi:N-acetyl sugar amidotransferase [Gammaproteobacteria bacterium]|nr:N-acetyl sugar amidotransferase [Gammaproteobacteria bacterium]